LPRTMPSLPTPPVTMRLSSCLVVWYALSTSQCYHCSCFLLFSCLWTPGIVYGSPGVLAHALNDLRTKDLLLSTTRTYSGDKSSLVNRRPPKRMSATAATASFSIRVGLGSADGVYHSVGAAAEIASRRRLRRGYSRSPKNPAHQLLQKSSKSASAGSLECEILGRTAVDSRRC